MINEKCPLCNLRDRSVEFMITGSSSGITVISPSGIPICICTLNCGALLCPRNPENFVSKAQQGYQLEAI